MKASLSVSHCEPVTGPDPHESRLTPEEGHRVMDGRDILSDLVQDRPVPGHQHVITQRAGLEMSYENVKKLRDSDKHV